MLLNSLPIHPTLEVEWNLLFEKQLPQALQLFMMQAFHCKMRVNSRMLTLTKSDRCPVCSHVESVDFAI